MIKSNRNDDIAHENAVLTAILQLRMFLRNYRGLSQIIVTDFAMVSVIDNIDHRSFDRSPGRESRLNGMTKEKS
jgi:hypothetical protein